MLVVLKCCSVPYVYLKAEDIRKFLYHTFVPVMELNQYDTELMSVVMDAFGRETILTRIQLLELFDNDESFALRIVQALMDQKRVSPLGAINENQLPEAITTVIPAVSTRDILWPERAAWFIAGVLITLLLGWLVMRTGHHHTLHKESSSQTTRAE